jgi:hypothetical protein
MYFITGVLNILHFVLETNAEQVLELESGVRQKH